MASDVAHSGFDASIGGRVAISREAATSYSLGQTNASPTSIWAAPGFRGEEHVGRAITFGSERRRPRPKRAAAPFRSRQTAAPMVDHSLDRLTCLTLSWGLWIVRKTHDPSPQAIRCRRSAAEGTEICGIATNRWPEFDFFTDAERGTENEV